MFFFLSKFLFFLLNPIVWIMGLMILGFRTKKPRRKSRLFLAAFWTLALFSNPFLKNKAFQTWEPDATILKDTFDVAIVLGGFTDMNAYPIERQNFGANVERLTQVLELYHQGFVKQILLTGGNSNIIDKKGNESKEVLDFLLNIGYPRAAILLEPKARNTYENALYSKAILDQTHPQGKFLLVTSAFHSYRAKKCFDKVKLTTTSYPVDYNHASFQWTPEGTFIPSIHCLKDWQSLIKEWVGIVVYKMKGYL